MYIMDNAAFEHFQFLLLSRIKLRCVCPCAKLCSVFVLFAENDCSGKTAKCNIEEKFSLLVEVLMSLPRCLEIIDVLD